MSLMRKHREQVLASAATAGSALAAQVMGRGGFRPGRLAEQLEAAGETGPRAVALQGILMQLHEDRIRLKGLMSVERKIALKRELLPRYAAWVDGVLSADRGGQDDVLVTVMVWSIDTGDYAGALRLADYVLKHKLAMPAPITRTPPVLITEEIAEAALVALKAGEGFPAEILQETGLLTEPYDMPDEVRAKLHKAIGLELASRLDVLADNGIAGARQAAVVEALSELRAAVRLNPKAGVVKDIERLEREMKTYQTETA